MKLLMMYTEKVIFKSHKGLSNLGKSGQMCFGGICSQCITGGKDEIIHVHTFHNYFMNSIMSTTYQNSHCEPTEHISRKTRTAHVG